MTVVDAVSAVLLVAGAAFGLVAGIGVVRLPAVLSRMHAATKPATLGLLLVVVAAALQLAGTAEVTKVVLVVVLQFVTAPVGAHLVGRAAHRAGVGRGELDLDETRDGSS